MGAWIEIKDEIKKLKKDKVAPHDGCVDWNHDLNKSCVLVEKSHPTMGAWIEIFDFESTPLLNWLSHPTMGAWIEIRKQIR